MTFWQRRTFALHPSNGDNTTPHRRIDDDPHQAPSNDAGNRQRDDPPSIDPQHHAPIDRTPRPGAEAHPRSRTSNTLRRRDRERQPRRQDDRNGRAKLHTKSPSRRVQRQPVPQIPHDIVPIGPEPDHDRGTAVDEDPDRDGRFAREFARVPDEEYCGKRDDGVRDVVGIVREGGHGCGEDLQEDVEVLGLVVEVGGLSVHSFDVACEEVLLTIELLVDDVMIHAAEEVVFAFLIEVGWVVPWAVVVDLF